MANELEQKRVVSFPESLRDKLKFDPAISFNLEGLLAKIGPIGDYVCDKLKRDMWYERKEVPTDTIVVIEEVDGTTQVYVENKQGEIKGTRFSVLPEEGGTHKDTIRDILQNRGYKLDDSLGSGSKSIYVKDPNQSQNEYFIRIRAEEITEGKGKGKNEIYLTAKNDVRTKQGDSNTEFEVSVDNLEACQRFVEAIGYVKCSSKEKLPSKEFKWKEDSNYSIEVNYIGDIANKQVIFVEIERKVGGELSQRDKNSTLTTIDSIFNQLGIPSQNIVVTKYYEIAKNINSGQ